MDTSGIVQIARNGCPGCAEPSPTGKPEFTAAIAPGSVKPSNLATIWASDGPSECFFDYWRCESCGLLHKAIQLHPELVADCYSQMNDNIAGVRSHRGAELAVGRHGGGTCTTSPNSTMSAEKPALDRPWHSTVSERELVQ